jgi:hypothetical protein
MPGNEDFGQSNGVLAIGTPGARSQDRPPPFPDQLREACLRLPAELLPRLAGIADQLIDFGGRK